MNEFKMLRKRFILKQTDPIREKWDYVVMILSIYNSCYLPFEQAFTVYEHCKFSNFEAIDYCNYFIDFAFFLDIILNFNTTYQDSKTGEEMTSRCDIFSNYVTTMFLLDILATVPIYEMFCLILSGNMSKQVQLLSMLKLVRVFRLQKVITYMNTTDDIKLTLQLVKTSIFLFIFIHISACVWFQIAIDDKKWVPGQTKLFGEIKANLYTDFDPFG